MRADPDEEVCLKCFHAAKHHSRVGCKVCRCLVPRDDLKGKTRRELIQLLREHRDQGVDIDQKIQALKQGKGMQPAPEKS